MLKSAPPSDACSIFVGGGILLRIMSAFNYVHGRSAEGTDTLSIHFNSCSREPLSWEEELYAAARTIVNRTAKPIWVCSSGGIDSETVCRAFYDQGMNFSVLTLEHAAGTNYHDIKYAIEWCRERGVHQKIVKIDMSAFLTSEVEEYASTYSAVHPFRYFQIKLMQIVEDMGGFAVLAGGEQLYLADRTKPCLTRDDLYLLFAVGNIAPLEWCKDNKVSHEPYFYFSTPELCLSYTHIPIISFALSNPDAVFRHKSNTYTLKRLAYQSVWTDIKARYKSDGFERIDPLVQDARKRMRERFGDSLPTFRLPVPEFERQLKG